MATATSLRRGIQQYQASTGRRITPEALQALLAAELDVQASRQSENKALELRQTALEEDIKQGRERSALDRERFGFEQSTGRERLDKEAQGAKFSGITQLAGTALQGGMLLKDTALGKAIGGKVAGAFGIGAPAATTGATAASTFSSSPAVTGYSATPSTFSAGSIGSEYGALETSGYTAGEYGTATTAGTAGTAAGGVAGGIAGGVATAMPYYGLAKAGGSVLTNNFDDSTIAGQSGESLQSPLGVEQYWLGEVDAPGALTVIADALNPLAPIESFVSKTFGTVICSELHRQKEIGDRELSWARIFRKKHVSDSTYKGYIVWATPVVRLMQTSSVFNRIFKPFAIALVAQWVNLAKGQKGSALQRAVYRVAFWASRTAYHVSTIRVKNIRWCLRKVEVK